MTRRKTSFREQLDPSEVRPCEWPGCPERAGYRAPKSRDDLRSYRWFCLEHIRAYNSAWNFYEGMSEEEVEKAVRADTTWNRPSWPLGSNGGSNGGHIGDSPESGQKSRYNWRGFGTIHDPFDLFEGAQDHCSPASAALSEPERKAARILDLEAPFTVSEVKARYKALVKRYHPDANGGDKAAEERFKRINGAYETLMKSLITGRHQRTTG